MNVPTWIWVLLAVVLVLVILYLCGVRIDVHSYHQLPR